MDKHPKEDLRKLVGICGIYCGTCPIYLAHRENDVECLDEISKARGIPLDKIQFPNGTIFLLEKFSSRPKVNLISSLGPHRSTQFWMI